MSNGNIINIRFCSINYMKFLGKTTGISSTAIRELALLYLQCIVLTIVLLEEIRSVDP